MGGPTYVRTAQASDVVAHLTRASYTGGGGGRRPWGLWGRTFGFGALLDTGFFLSGVADISSSTVVGTTPPKG